jgi:hypothetical protein
MKINQNDSFLGKVTTFHGLRLPEAATPAGYAALIDRFDLKAPLPRQLMAIGEHHRTVHTEQWRILTPRHAPQPTLKGHLIFALKYEAVNLLILKRLFEAVGPGAIIEFVQSVPTSAYARRIWFLYEWLLGEELDLPNAPSVKYVPIIDAARQFAIEGNLVTRHRVRNNLPGTPRFCPLVSRSELLDDFVESNLADQARQIVARIPKDILARTAAFLLLNDSKSSYAIEGERPPQNRIQRWGQAVGEAGRNPIDLDELLRLQLLVIGDTRFIQPGLRQEGEFVGEHDRITGAPLPVHISARADDLDSLINGMIDFEQGPANELNPVIAGAIFAFGFVYTHPFQDGNGRIHRYLIHHLLARRGFSPQGLIFPISAAILERIDEYRNILEDYSARLLPLIDWQPTGDGNVRVRNDTGDFYRFFDATPHAEFLFSCVQQTIEHDLPEEASFLERYDKFCLNVESLVDMPSKTLDMLFRFLHQNQGKLSQRARKQEFALLSDDEILAVERFYEGLFNRNSG